MIVQVINETWLDFYLSNFMGNLKRNIKQQHKLDKNFSGILNTFEESLKAEVGDVVTGNVLTKDLILHIDSMASVYGCSPDQRGEIKHRFYHLWPHLSEIKSDQWSRCECLL